MATEVWPRSGSVASGDLDIDGERVEYCIVPHPCMERGGLSFPCGLNGYVCFPRRPVREPGYRGIITYVPVHGGITLAHEMDDGRMIYGFDTGHIEQGDLPIRNPEWIRRQCEVMARGILKAAEVEADYLLAWTNEEKAIPAQAVQDVNENRGFSMGVALKLLGGEL